MGSFLERATRRQKVPADGVKGKTWGPSTGGYVLNNLMMPTANASNSGGASKNRPSIPEDQRWSQSVSSLEQKSPRSKSGMHTVTSVPEIDVDTAVSGSSGGHEATPPPSSIASSDQTLRYHQTSQSANTDNVIPMPTLYNDSHDTTDGRPRHHGQQQPRLGTIEVLLYNMASMLAGVAVGYDVRLTNVSPIHPKLYPKRNEDEESDDHSRFYYESNRNGPPLYPHNTYHGPGLGYNHHQRTPLAQANFRPLKFTDSYSPSPVGGASQEDEELIGQYPPPPPVATGPGLDRPLYIPTPDYNSEGYTMNRTRMFYQDHLDDQHQQQQPPPPVPGAPNFVFPDNARGERRISGETRPNYAVESPRQNEARYRSSHHRRSSSNSSSTAFNSPYNNSDVWSTTPMGAPSPSGTDQHHYSSSSRKFSRQSSHTSPTSLDLERPQTLELPMTPRTPLRSSLRKNSTYSRYVPGGGGGSSGGTPTNPTPPDSLSEEVPGGGASMMPGIGASRSDSGFVSTSNRVRFSPSPFEKSGSAYVTDWSPTHEPPPPVPVSTATGNRQQVKAPFPMQRQSRTTPVSSASSVPTHHYITESDLQRDFNLYPQS